MNARQHAINVHTRIEASRAMHILGNFSPTTQTYECVKCGLVISPAIRPSVPECPDYARRKGIQ